MRLQTVRKEREIKRAIDEMLRSGVIEESTAVYYGLVTPRKAISGFEKKHLKISATRKNSLKILKIYRPYV